MTIAARLSFIQKTITDTAIDCGRDPSTIKLVAVSKHHSIASIEEAVETGQHLFGENYIQEAAEKRKQIDNRAAFHFIGHVQTNKAKLAAKIFTMVETVDRYKLAKVLNTHMEKLGRSMDILIQVNIGRDENKSGIEPEKTKELLEQIKHFDRLHPLGLMTIPPYTTNPEDVRKYFKRLYCLGRDLAEQKLFADNMNIELSMGMSQDFKIAIEEGATIIRVGTAIFGARKGKG